MKQSILRQINQHLGAGVGFGVGVKIYDVLCERSCALF